MSLATLAILLSAIGIPLSWSIAFAYLKDPAEGMKKTEHRLDCLPLVMTDRYVVLALLATAATVYRDLYVIAFLGACVGYMSLADAVIYGRRGFVYRRHLIVGLMSVAIAAFALYAQLMTGVAA
jgi:hypothetical protein